MTSMGRIIAKCAFAAAVVTGIFAASQLSERKAVATWAPNARLDAKPAPAAPLPVTEQRLAADDQSCAAQVWPNISKECITGRVEGERKEPRAVASPQPQLAALAAAPAPARSSTVVDVGTTGTVPAVTAPEPAVQAVPAAPRPREVHRPRNKPPARPTAAAERAPSSSGRVREPVQFSLAEGRN
jgi:hypothetical protein